MNTNNLKTAGWSYYLILIFLATCSTQLKSQESVIVRTDRDIYIAGESIWCQLDCVKSGTSQPSQISQVVYVELLNQRNMPVVQLKFNSKGQSIQTRIQLADSLSTGNYSLRAYTQWMRNYDEKYYGRKTISVVSPFAVNSLPQKHEYFTTDTLFVYPEGGNFLTHTSNKLLLQTVKKNGMAHSVTGSIITDQKDTLRTLTTNKQGYAIIQIQPDSSTPLYFVYEKDKKPILLPLPILKDAGYNIQISKQQKETIFFRIQAKPDLVNINLSLLLTTLDGKLISDYPVNQQKEIQVKLEDLKNPINCALLVSENGKVLSKRVFAYENTSENASLKLSLNKSNHHRRELVQLSATNNSNKKLRNTTISVTKKCLHNKIVSHVDCLQETSPLLYHQLKSIKLGGISDNDWLIGIHPTDPNLNKNTTSIFLPEMKGEIISGIVTDSDIELPVKDELMVLSFVGNKSIICLAQTDSTGRFNFEVNQFGEKEMVIQPLKNDTSIRNYKITLSDTYSNEYSTGPCPNFALSTEKANLINEAIINMQLNRVYETYHPPFDSQDTIVPVVSFYNHAETKIETDKYIELSSVEEIIKEIVPGTALRKQKGQSKFIVFEKHSLYPSNGPTLAMVDGVPIHDTKTILELSPQEIDHIEVINLNYFVDGIKLGRLLCFYTQSGNMGSMSFDTHIFRQARQCYSYNYSYKGPKYSSSQAKASKLPDFRNMLHYQTIDISSKETKTISFYTSDESTEYMIVVEGIRNDGQIERVELPLIVQE
ncbi:MAG: hypothetical protein JEZ14_13345 [Marinilabiliaceae bacterium]|nr:hypothetical protein [Marinilabiliaceae bacterium]